MRQLLVVAGPTAVGKTAYAIRLAQQLHTEILSCDSRQFYSELNIGVARPSEDELRAAPHHFVACRSVQNPFNIYDYEQQAVALLDRLFQSHEVVVAVGGSGLYIDALVKGCSRMPDPAPELRMALQHMPLAEKQERLLQLDPDYYNKVDLRNPVRLQRALEVCITTGKPYSQVLAESQPAPRPFQTEVRVLQLPPQSLRQRIDSRVDLMIQQGLLQEVADLVEYKHLNTLRTVGYTELFDYLEGKTSLDEAVALIKLNTWHYARKQMTWMRRYQ